MLAFGLRFPRFDQREYEQGIPDGKRCMKEFDISLMFDRFDDIGFRLG